MDAWAVYCSAPIAEGQNVTPIRKIEA